MGWLDAALSIGGAVAGAWASKEKSDAIEDQAKDQAAAVKADAKANAALSRYDASVVRSQAEETFKAYQLKLNRAYRMVDTALGTQRTQLGKAGVVGDTGSGIKLQQETVREAYQDIEIMRYNGRKAVDRIESLAKKYDLMAEKGLRESTVYASSILEAGSNLAQASLMEGIANFGTQIAEVSDKYDWWE